jgi:DNA/RNA endonuclease YhcR with UshA esterase domain
MKRMLIVCSTAAMGFACTLYASAHHSFAAEYDIKKPISMTGTVTSVEWQNPHTWFYIDVKDDAGNVTSWGMELASPNLLIRNGWTRSTLRAGDVVSVEGYGSKDSKNIANARTIVIQATGQRLVAGSSAGSTP